MELTITQNGALYAVQHGAIKKYRGGRNKRAIANKLNPRHPKFRIDYVVSPNRIDEKSIPRLVPDIEKPILCVSVPEPMVESMGETMKKIGVPGERIKNGSFPGYEWPYESTRFIKERWR